MPLSLEERTDRRTALGLLVLAVASVTARAKAASRPALLRLAAVVPSSKRIPASVLKGWADFNGTYSGTWRDSTAAIGTLKVVARIDASKRTATFTLSIGRSFLGRGSPARTETLLLRVDDYPFQQYVQVATTILGPVTLSGPRFGYVRLDAHRIPGHPEITSFSIKGYVTGPDVLPNGNLPFHYEIRRKSGPALTGNAEFAYHR
jgi:hypothetical protein